MSKKYKKHTKASIRKMLKTRAATMAARAEAAKVGGTSIPLHAIPKKRRKKRAPRVIRLRKNAKITTTQMDRHLALKLIEVALRLL